MMIRVVVFAALVVGAHAHIYSKMNAAPVADNRRLHEEESGPEDSGFALFMGECYPELEFLFPVSAGNGLGFLALTSGTDANIDVDLVKGSGSITVDEMKETSIFGFDSAEEADGVAGRLTFSDISNEGGLASVTCDKVTYVLVAYKDDSEYKLKYSIRKSKDKGGVVHEEVDVDDVDAKTTEVKGFSKRRRGGRQLSTGSKSTSSEEFSDVDGEIRSRISPVDGESGRVRSSNSVVNNVRPVSSQENSLLGTFSLHPEQMQVRAEAGHADRVAFKNINADEVVIGEYETVANGKTVYRTVIVDTQNVPDVVDLSVVRAVVNEEGDVEVTFGNLPEGYILLKVRFLISINGVKENGDVDVNAIVEDGTVVLHGGWIRKKLREHGVAEDDSRIWSLDVVEAVALDPENGYAVVGVLREPYETSVHHDGRRHLVVAEPFEGEMEITMEMMQGRKPEELSRRRLQGSKLILSHGYCSGASVFPPAHFTNSVTFADPNANRSHDDFARRIRDFANAQGIGSCSIVAHSQGGAASLHLYNYYWSCLDNSSGGRKIQSVGTPYQGTPLAGNLAALGEVFGAGCGYNNDLTTSGASNWLNNISSSARSQVTYFTTAFKDNWWSYDYCQIATDVFLDDPDDGTTEKKRGQLSGANNGGHKDSWCHTGSMSHPAQYLDESRNRDMNNRAAR